MRHSDPKTAIEFFKYRAGALSPAKMGGWQSTRPMKGQQSLISGVMQLSSRYQRVVEKLLRPSTRRRHYYELVLAHCRVILNEGSQDLDLVSCLGNMLNNLPDHSKVDHHSELDSESRKGHWTGFRLPPEWLPDLLRIGLIQRINNTPH